MTPARPPLADDPYPEFPRLTWRDGRDPVTDLLLWALDWRMAAQQKAEEKAA